MSMKLAVTIWNNRVAPVFDCAGTVLLLEVSDGAVLDETTIALKIADIRERIDALAEAGVKEVICGALSGEARGLLRERGIAAHAFVAGEIGDVLNAWMRGALRDEAFSMPGCGCARRRRGTAGAVDSGAPCGSAGR